MSTTEQATKPDTNATGLMGLSAYVMKKAQVPQVTGGISRMKDPFEQDYRSGKLHEPWYSLETLDILPEYSRPLAACIGAMVTNVHGFGWEFAEHGIYKDEPGKIDDAAAADERRRLSLLFSYPNSYQDFTTLRKDTGRDYEALGWWLWEVVRNQKNEICELHRLPASRMRISVRDEEWTQFMQPIRDEEGNYEKIQRFGRFRRYVQRVNNGLEDVYFKEFRDPRKISATTGEPAYGKADDLANEVIMMQQTVSYTPYGVPRWISGLMGILGSRLAEQVNHDYFNNKAIPPMVVCVSGGNLLQRSETTKKLQEVIRNEIKGVSNFQDILVLEATPSAYSDMDDDKVSQVKIDIKPLTPFMAKDGQFLNYLADNKKALREIFRLAPLYFGGSDDYNKATSEQARQICEEQVFIPERRPFDYTINATILADMGIKYLSFRSLGAKTVDHAESLKAMSGVKEAIPVKDIIETVREMRGVPIGELRDEFATMTLSELQRQGMDLGPSVGEEHEETEEGEEPEGEEPENFIKKLQALRAHLQKRVTEDLNNGG